MVSHTLEGNNANAVRVSEYSQKRDKTPVADREQARVLLEWSTPACEIAR